MHVKIRLKWVGSNKNMHDFSGCNLLLQEPVTYADQYQRDNHSSHGLKGKTLLVHVCNGIRLRSASGLLLRSRKELIRRKANALGRGQSGEIVQRNSISPLNDGQISVLSSTGADTPKKA